MVSCCVNCEQGANRLSSQTKWNVKEKRGVENDHKEVGLKRKATIAVMEGGESGRVWRGAWRLAQTGVCTGRLSLQCLLGAHM